ncbi:OmpG porin family protein, partial [Fusobacterium sp.]|uniref:OmpG porin family protein n=1 Tax=Fusobacterium sp. TaxID=68766 RepID=UPI002608C966
KKLLLVTGLTALACTTAFAEENASTSKWTGQIVPRIEIEDTNNYGGDEAHPMWIKRLNGTLKHKDYSNWTFTYELKESEKDTVHFFDNVNGTTTYRVYPGIEYSRKVTDKLTLGLGLKDKWELDKDANGKSIRKINSYRLVPNFSYQITDKLDFHGKAYFIKNIHYDRASTSQSLKNSDGYEVQTGFTYRFAPGCYFLADYWEEGSDLEHDYTGADKKRSQQIRPILSLKVSEKNTLELYGRIQILDGEVTKDEGNGSGKLETKRNRYGFDFIHRINEQFTLNAGFAIEPNKKVIDYDGSVKKSDWYYYTARIAYKF